MPINDTNISNDDFWLNIAAESIYNTYEKRIKAIENLQKLIGWATGLFSTSSFLFYFFPKAGGLEGKALYFFYLAIAFLVVGYFFSSASGFPSPSKYNPNDPNEIKDKFSKSVVTSTILFNISVLFVFAGFLCIALGIIKQVAPAERQAIAEKKEIKVMADLEVRGDSTFIPVLIENATSLKARAIVRGFKTSFIASKTNPVILVENGLYPADTLGRVFLSIYVKDKNLKFFDMSISFTQIKSTTEVTETTFRKKLEKK
jgi:hypothetical protein